MAEALHDKHFPGESPEYRAARDRLLVAERDLRRAIETVAEQRRALPAGGVVPEDYVFEEVRSSGAKVALSELFAPGLDTLVVYSFMFAPDWEHRCPSCTSILDSLDGEVRHITRRANLAVVAKAPPERIAEHADARGWRNLRLLSSGNNTYFDPGQEGRHVDLIWPLWHVLDATPQGRGEFNAQLSYDAPHA